MSTSTPASAADPSEDFLSNILTPGSSLHPTFLLILDLAFTALLLVFLTAAVLTRGNVHILVLTGIELCLWGSVKWYVNELKMLELEQTQKQGAEVEGEAEGAGKRLEREKAAGAAPDEVETKKTI